MLTFAELFFAFQIGALAYVLTCVLMQQDYLLEWYFDLLVDLEQDGKAGKWLSKPLGLCEVCTAGQIALWVWLYFNYQDYALNAPEALLRTGLFIAFAIIFVTITKSTLNKWKQ